MKITREFIINGIAQNAEYELTGVELERAFNEYQSLLDKRAVYEKLEELEYEDVENVPDEILSDLASQYRDKIDTMAENAVNSVIERNAECLAEYKDKWKVFTKTIRIEVEKEYSIKAKNEEDADAIWEKWFERHGEQVINDLEYEMDTQDIDEDDPEEDEYGDPEYADIIEGRDC